MPPEFPMSRLAATILILMLAAGLPSEALGYQFELIVVGNDSRAIHLRVGDRAPGDMTTNYTDGYEGLDGFIFCVLLRINCAGGSPSTGGAVTLVSANVPANQVGTGAPIAMSSNSTGAHLDSSHDGVSRCSAGDVYIGGFTRNLGGSVAGASLSVQAQPYLQNGAHTIPISEISWIAINGGGEPVSIASGTFNGSLQQIGFIPANTWVEACMRFTYANTQVPAAGTYTARATYTLALP